MQKIVMINMVEEEELDILKQLANDIAKSNKKWIIIKEINNMIDTHYDKFYFAGILAYNNILKPEYFKIIEKLENRELLIALRKFIREIIFNRN